MATIWPREIMTPLHVHGARSPREYLCLQAETIARGRVAHPFLDWHAPHEAEETVEAFVAGGKWLVRCPCGNYPSAHPAWQLACCLECGAIYRRIVLPAQAAEIARLLVLRPQPANRAWLPHETIEDLMIQNLQHGVGA